MLNKLGIKSKEKMAINNFKKLNVAFKEIEMENLQEKVIGGTYYPRRGAYKVGKF